MKNKITSRIMAALMTLMMILQAAMPATTVFAQEGGGKEEPSYQVKFIVTPEDAEITVKDGEDKEIEPSKEDKTVYELKEGSYKYSVSKEGYEAVKDEKLEVDKDQEVKVDLIKVKSDEKETESTIKEAEKKIEDEVEKLTPQLFRAPAVGSKLSTTDIKTYSFDIIDGTHGGAKIDYKTQGDSGYNDYLSNPSKFNQPVGKDQKESELSLKFNFTYKGEVKAGDTLEIPVSLGDEFNDAKYFNIPLRDGSGNNLGEYAYSKGKFVLTFSGDYVKNHEVKSATFTLNAGPVKVPNTKLGTGINGEKTVIHGKVLGSNIIAGYEKKNKEKPAGPGPLNLDDVKIKSFKIIDVANGNKEIDYRTSDQSEYIAFKNDPSKFSNTINQNQKNSEIVLKLSMEYKSDKALLEGDTLTIPANFGGVSFDFASQPLFDGAKNQIGTWEYKKGNIEIKFSGNYIKNQQVKQFTASFETGKSRNVLGRVGKTTIPGARGVLIGTLGKNNLSTSAEKLIVVAKKINATYSNINKAATSTSDKMIRWSFSIESDVIQDGKDRFFNPYMLENGGKYSSRAYSEIYIEDTFVDVVSEPQFSNIWTGFGSINNKGEVISQANAVNIPKTLLKKIEQGGKTKEQVKNSLKQGEYCMFRNADDTYTLMLKWWNMNDGTGLTFDKIPEIQEAGGVGNYLKKTDPALYGELDDTTIEKINEIYRGKAPQNVYIPVQANYSPVKELTEVKNTAKITTKQTGEKDYPAVGTLTPPAGIADAPADPLSVKLIKSDRKTGAALSKGFKFELQNTKDNGTTWTKVNVDASMLEECVLNPITYHLFAGGRFFVVRRLGCRLFLS